MRAPITAKEAEAEMSKEPARVCATCNLWVRINPPRTTFGTCTRWQHVMQESRDGVSSAPLLPVTPEFTSCSEWDLRDDA